jgi:hypothetical protein
MADSRWSFAAILLASMVAGCSGSDSTPADGESAGTGSDDGTAGSASGGGRNTGGRSSSGGDRTTGGRTSGGGSTSESGGQGNAGSPESSGTGGAGSGDLPTLGGCTLFTADDEWNREVYEQAADADWTGRLQDLVGGVRIHPDFGGSGEYGIPINVVPETQPLVDVSFSYDDESDPGPYPFPVPGEDTFEIEGHSPESCDGDCHLLVVQSGTCMLYEGYACEYQRDSWDCGSGAQWDLTQNSYGQRPDGWTSADAAGLPITPGILRYDEVLAGAVRHAIRFTVHCSSPHYVKPATHFAVPGNCNEDISPPMGLRVRLRRDFRVDGFSEQTQIILTAMQHYGMILADNGSDFYFQGDADPDWPEEVLDELKSISSSEFEVVAPVPPLGP